MQLDFVLSVFTYDTQSPISTKHSLQSYAR